MGQNQVRQCIQCGLVETGAFLVIHQFNSFRLALSGTIGTR